jgi:hypothetical protein
MKPALQIPQLKRKRRKPDLGEWVNPFSSASNGMDRA